MFDQRMQNHGGVLLLLSCLLGAVLPAVADQRYSQQVFFENSLSPGNYYYSSGKASSPSTLELIDGHLPVETSSFISGPNAIELQWESIEDGGWEAELILYKWRDRDVDFPGDSLLLWLCSKEGIRARDLPKITLRDLYGNFTRPLSIAGFTKDLERGKWIRVRIPLSEFHTASLQPFESRRLSVVGFVQGAADQASHTLFLDDIRVEDNADSVLPAPAAPRSVQAKGYERHIDVTWAPVEDAALAQYVIYRSMHGEPFRAIGIQRAGVNRFADYVGDANSKASYKVSARTSSLHESPLSGAAEASTHPMSDEDLLTMVQEASFRYYWEAAEPHSGMTRENTPGNDDIVAVGASGFGIMAIIVATDRGLVPRQQAIDRLLRITAFLDTADRFHGAWPHFLSGSTGRCLPVFGMVDNGADLVETSFLMEGLLAAREYFKGTTPKEGKLTDRITSLWEGVEWDWFLAPPAKDALYWHWSPDYSYYIANRLAGWNEVMITYLLAIASPTHGVPGSLYYTGWAGEAIHNPYKNGTVHYGIKLDVGQGTGGPIFFTHYSFLGYDPRHLRDRYANYFEHNRNQSLVNQAYCIENPSNRKGYGADTWGITAVDGPEGYSDFEPTPKREDGTIAPTGAISAFAYTPEQSLLALKHYYRDLGAQVWDIYGFRDSFNQQQNWYSGITMGLNQAPMAVMIENHRSELVWRSFMANPEVARMVKQIGLQPDKPHLPK